MSHQKFNRVGFVVVLAVVAFGYLAVSARADVIYSDTFTRSGDLNGSSPDSTSGSYGGTSGAKWDASTNWQTNGTQATLGTAMSNAFLAFTPDNNRVYTLSCDLNSTGTVASLDSWMAVGFAQSIVTTDSPNGNGENISAWFLERNSLYTGGTNMLYTVMGPDFGGGNTSFNISGPHTFSTVLDTTTALWSVTFKVDGVPKSTFMYTANPTINYITLGNEFGTGYVDNLTLSVAVPEPCTLTLLVTGLVGLLAYAWRKRK